MIGAVAKNLYPGSEQDYFNKMVSSEADFCNWTEYTLCGDYFFVPSHISILGLIPMPSTSFYSSFLSHTNFTKLLNQMA